MTGEELVRTHYIIRGGIEGRERLRVLSRVMRPTTLSLFQRVGVCPGMVCLDVGCGGGDVSFDIARLVGPAGRVVGVDIDEIKIEIAGGEAVAQQIANIEFRFANIDEIEPEAEFDFAYSRFVLSHLRDPATALAKIRRAIRPGGIVVVADTDFRGQFCDPDSPALWRFVDLFTQTLKHRGGDANIGPRLPRLLSENGFEGVTDKRCPAGGTGRRREAAHSTYYGEHCGRSARRRACFSGGDRANRGRVVRLRAHSRRGGVHASRRRNLGVSASGLTFENAFKSAITDRDQCLLPESRRAESSPATLGEKLPCQTYTRSWLRSDAGVRLAHRSDGTMRGNAVEIRHGMTFQQPQAAVFQVYRWCNPPTRGMATSLGRAGFGSSSAPVGRKRIAGST